MGNPSTIRSLQLDQRKVLDYAKNHQETKSLSSHPLVQFNEEKYIPENKVLDTTYKRISAASFVFSEAPALVLSNFNQIVLEGQDSEIESDFYVKKNISIVAH